MTNNVCILSKGGRVKLGYKLNQSEIDCKCASGVCTITQIARSIISSFCNLRKEVGRQITVNSGFRCINHNSEEEGRPKSKHLSGFAIDLAFPAGISKDEFRKLCVINFDRVINYPTFLHCENNIETFKPIEGN